MHTPGPWHAEKDGELNLTPYFVIWADGEPVDPDNVVAYTRDNKQSCLNGEANARLIAAAPELLEALKLCLDFNGSHEAMLANDHKARAAIAKAEGG